MTEPGRTHQSKSLDIKQGCKYGDLNVYLCSDISGKCKYKCSYWTRYMRVQILPHPWSMF